MTKEVKITCDNCGADLTSTGSIPKFRLHLESEALPHTSGTIAAVMVYPAIEDDLYFCGLKCLREWTVKK